MNESPQRQAVILGLFIAIGLGILAGGVMAIGGLNDRFSQKIHVSATFANVGGLQKGDKVWYSGVSVGTVQKIGFDDASHVHVDLGIDAKASAFIPADVHAKIGSDGFIGNTLVVLFDGTQGGPDLADGATVETVEALSTEQMFAMLDQNNKNILSITEDLKGLTARISAGEGSIGKLLKDEALFTDLKLAVSDLKDVSSNAKAMSGQLATFSSKMNREGSLPNEIVTDQDTWASLQSSVKRLESVTTSLEKPAGPVGVLLNDPAAAQDLGETLENLNTGSAALAENMEALQHNFLLRGYFKKQEKKQEEAAEE